MLENTIYDSKLRRRRSRKMAIWEGAQGPDPVPNPPWGGGVDPRIYPFKPKSQLFYSI